MATWDDVRRIALALPETTETTSHGNPAWKVKDRLFVWDRPLRQTDHAALGDAAPDGPILGVRVAEPVMDWLLADNILPIGSTVWVY